MKRCSIDEVLKITGGRLLTGVGEQVVRCVSTDSRTVQPGALFFAIKGPRFDGHDFLRQAFASGAVAAMVSDEPPVPASDGGAALIKVPDTTAALGRLAAWHRTAGNAKVIAVTGSNGKTTTKSMIAALLSPDARVCSAPRSYNNDIGVPLTLLAADAHDEYLVVEVGTNAPGEVAALSALARPDIAVVTSVGRAHLAGLGSVQGVVDEKLSMLEHLEPAGTAVINFDHPRVRQSCRGFGGRLVTFGLHRSCDYHVGNVQCFGDGVAFMINDTTAVRLSVPGRHNAVNASAAYAVGLQLGLSGPQLIERLAAFVLPDMRLQVQRRGTRRIINDAYNANPDSMRAAIEYFGELDVPGRRVAVIGDMLELGRRASALHRELGRLIADSDIDVLFAVGQYARRISESAAGARRGNLETHTCRSVGDLEASIHEHLRPDDTILIKGSRALRLERLLRSMQGDGTAA